ncbi:hypothetical protein [Caulobacter phage DCM]|uniref:Uncharacterized protein n=1 Tax=Caulobacter phage DCM TaxID=3020391 RepID=A0AAE9X4B9_9CAUD|nr:hypothetical protein [Caulobacter phage DCM]WCD56132.1 hypothetical protein [Caulobacter phage BL199]
MQEASLPAPGIGGQSHHLRRIAAKALNYIETNAPNYTNGKHPAAYDLKAFFDACSTAVAGYVVAGQVTPGGDN